MKRNIIFKLWKAFGLFLLFLLIVFTGIWFGWIGYMPDIEDIENPISRFATQVYSSDGKIIGTYSIDRENRICIPYDQISPHLVKALVATEDERFYEHSGVDYIALGRALVKRGLLQRASAGGGSTITQQLAKQLYSGKAHNTLERLLQKPIEWVIAVKLEHYYTKEEIIAFYLNYFDFLYNAVGIKSAANTYFNKEARDLSLTESATLVGLCKNPSLFNPVRYPDRAISRRNVVLQQMVKAGYLSESEYDKASKEPLNLDFHRKDHKEGQAAYFREFLRRYMMAHEPQRNDYPEWNQAQYVYDSVAWQSDPLYGWCNKNHKRNGEAYNIYTDGLKIFTTIDSRMQRYAEEAVDAHVGHNLQPKFFAESRNKPNAPYSSQLTTKQVQQILDRAMRQSERYRVLRESGADEETIRRDFNTPVEMTVFSYQGDRDTTMTPMDSIRYYKKFLRAGFMSMDAQTGAVKAYVGGINFRHFQYDMVSLGRRQVGSTIKPFLYSMAMENGYSPCDVVPNVQTTYYVAGQPWTPRNGSRAHYGEMVTLKWGLAQSNNWVSAYLMNEMNPYQFVELLHSFGINNPNIHPSLALCLGPCEVSVAEMVSAYTTFPNKGIRCAPLFVTRIEDSEGNVIAQFQPILNEVISSESAYKMLIELQGVIDGGTGSRVRYMYNIAGPLGGKTGTTNRNSDGWFVGFTPQLVSACWVGGDDRDIHFDSMAHGQGAAAALPIWGIYMKKVLADKDLGYTTTASFDIPEGYNPCGTVIPKEESQTIEEVVE